ncbi:hypothetical protein Gohar_009173 [Gossypium harknessii]|uniref:Uncharacterized protein n=1 Tax=Gossypium harknessii TaxID=34285 RepID=A0A7J9GLZ2_9ROSI|nr:hypothetical protein [Gossypium harknessii]
MPSTTITARSSATYTKKVAIPILSTTT